MIFVLATTHRAVVAQRDTARGRVEHLAFELQQAREDNRHLREKLGKVSACLDASDQALTASEDARAALAAELAPFKTPRKRDAKGHFLKGDRS